MKIYEKQGLNFNQIDNNKKNLSIKTDFQSIMNQLTTTSSNQESNASSIVPGPIVSGTGIVFKADPIDSSSEMVNKEQVVAGLKDTLDLVDHYAKKLADSSLSSDSLSPLVKELEQRMEALKDMGSAADANDKLKSIISDVTSTMGVEIERFKRGDYV